MANSKRKSKRSRQRGQRHERPSNFKKPRHLVFPVGYHELHPDISVNFQMNRFYGCVGDESMLTEMREAAPGVHDYPTFTKIFLDLGDKALARHETLKGAYYLRLARVFLFTKDLRKLPTRQRFVDLVLGSRPGGSARIGTPTHEPRVGEAG